MDMEQVNFLYKFCRKVNLDFIYYAVRELNAVSHDAIISIQWYNTNIGHVSHV